MSTGNIHRAERTGAAAAAPPAGSLLDGPLVNFSTIFDYLPTPHLLLDINFDIVAANEAYLDLVGQRRADLFGVNIFAAISHDGEDEARLRESLRNVREQGKADQIPLLSFTLQRADAAPERRFWSCTHTPIRDVAGRVAFILQQAQDVTELHRAKNAVTGPQARPEPLALSSAVLHRAETVQAVNRTLLAEYSHLRRLIMQAPGLMCVLSGPDLVFELVNNAYLDAVGHRDLVGRPIREALPEMRGQGHFELLETVMATGQPFIGQAMRISLQRNADGAAEERYFDLVYQPIAGAGSSVSGIFVAGVDITDRILAQEQQRLLMDELNHRVKNTLATVQAIAAQTLRSGDPPERFVKTFKARLMALSRTHNALTRGQWHGADLADILREELHPYGSTRFRLHGPDLHLPSRAVLSLGMVFHELAVNAVKYGSLSAPDGRLEITWSSAPADDGTTLLTFDWCESGGPSTAAPRQKGFGSRLIERSIIGELNGQLSMDYRPTGLVCQFVIKLRGQSI